MSSVAPPAAQDPRLPRKGGQRIYDFWQRVSEGRAIDDLWSQFAADAQSSYGFYGKDVDWEEINKLPYWKRPFPILRQFFWALMNKLSPARRVLLLVALALLFVSGIKVQSHDQSVEINFEFVAAILFLLLLSLELADKVIMKRDLEIAREIQSWLVPSDPPAIQGAEVAFSTRPQNSVAGDYYDAFYPDNDAASGGKLMLVMADVAGKSVPAALLMATLQASLHTLASEGLPLVALAERLNRYASAHSLDGRRFTTAVIAEYQPATRCLTYVNAGHNAPILRRASGSIERLESGSVPFGISSEMIFTASEVSLEPGDTLILFTDGVVEAFNSSLEEFSDPRWVSVVRHLPILSAKDSLQFLMKQVDDFVGATRQSDDITCLVLRCS
ncbi:MAG TPA: PP2C family protein-serine/threonine phosphatase [Candidatus Acidoferrum sp.]|jgi:serine phosphatase RsbU (regulator of sigma subunit)